MSICWTAMVVRSGVDRAGVRRSARMVFGWRARRHAPDDPCLGEPLCTACFDYEGAVAWNNVLGELWRRTTIYLPRQLAALLGVTQKRLHELVRVSYVKVAEYQTRGLVHVHP
jgi:hypothetical protein